MKTFSRRSVLGTLAVAGLSSTACFGQKAVDLTPEAAARAAAEAVDVARIAAAISTERIELAGEPAHGEVTWLSSYEADPFEITVADKTALLSSWSRQLLDADGVDHVDASLYQVKECKIGRAHV